MVFLALFSNRKNDDIKIQQSKRKKSLSRFPPLTGRPLNSSVKNAAGLKKSPHQTIAALNMYPACFLQQKNNNI
jgi:hypothetical protein